MYKRLISLLLIWLLGHIAVQAQITMTLQVPPVGVMQKGQLWNMALIYTGNGTISVSIALTMLGARDNQPVMTALSRPIMLSKGTNLISVKDASPIQYDYLSPVFNVDRDPNGFLPVGNYKVCYTVLQGGGHGEGPFVEDCLPVEVQPLSPPQLNTPADTSTLEITYPQFSWLPAMPISLFSNLSYDMLLVEVLPGQGSYEAIQQNIPVYNTSHYKDQVLQYPASNAPLDTGRVYAWRVIAKNEDEFVSQSEVWTFKLATRKPAVVKPSNGNYILLHMAEEPSAGTHELTENVLGIKYYSFDREHETTVNFLGSDGQLIRSVQQKIAYGDNFLVFTLDRSFQKGKIYQVVIDDLRNNHHTASFTIKSPN
jgi:hypothetical protein